MNKLKTETQLPHWNTSPKKVLQHLKELLEAKKYATITILFLIFPEKVENWLIRIYGILFLIQLFIIFLDLYNEKLDRDIYRLNNEIDNILNK